MSSVFTMASTTSPGNPSVGSIERPSGACADAAPARHIAVTSVAAAVTLQMRVKRFVMKPSFRFFFFPRGDLPPGPLSLF
jgi:hypothetical protein